MFSPTDEHPVTEIDLSGYQYDIVPTYKMIEDDIDDQDSLFRIQFLQAFGITTDEYQPEIVCAVITNLYERFRENPAIREILESHPLFQRGVTSTMIEEDDDSEDTTTPHLSPSQSRNRRSRDGATGADNSEMIFCMMFSFQTFDLFHMCLRHARNREEIPTQLRDEIVECFRTMF
jgi:hypothetical protein